MAKIENNKSGGLLGWVDERFPLSSFIKNHLTEYYAPKNFNFWFFFFLKKRPKHEAGLDITNFNE